MLNAYKSRCVLQLLQAMDMTCRCPKLVAGRISLLIGHLGGKAYSLRSAIITAIGHLVQKAFENVPGEDADAQGELHTYPVPPVY